MNNCQDNESGCKHYAASDKRRRLVQGIGAGVLTVTAKSSLATTGNCLSPSASASISLLHSRPNRDRWDCKGRTPGFWINAATTHPLDWQYAGQTGDGEVFSTVFLSGYSERLRIVMGMSGNQDQWQLGAHLSAAYLNMKRGWVPTSVLDITDLRAMWAGRYGTYSPTSGVTWGGEQIVSYLQTTMTL